MSDFTRKMRMFCVGSVLLLGGYAFTGVAQEAISTFPYVENFDDAEDYGTLPAGWTTVATGAMKFSVGMTYDFGPGETAQTGTQFLGTSSYFDSNREDVAFSPLFEMTAGTEYTMTVWVKSPGLNNRYPTVKITAGLAQVKEAQTTVLAERAETFADWTELTYTFTPETDGQYCFGLWYVAGWSNAGNLFYDSFSVTTANGSGGEGWQATLPYLETFDDATHYSGEEHLPIGWLATGDETFVTANITGKPAVSGEYYIVARDYIASNRQEIAYSPLLEMEQGTEYQVSLYLYMPGNVSDPSFKLTVGNAQESAAHATVLREVADTRLADWTRVDATFTPEADGPYCFGLWAVSKESNGGHIAIDNFSITGSRPGAAAHSGVLPRRFDAVHHNG